jgi:hypothetical protein
MEVVALRQFRLRSAGGVAGVRLNGARLVAARRVPPDETACGLMCLSVYCRGDLVGMATPQRHHQTNEAISACRRGMIGQLRVNCGNEKLHCQTNTDTGLGLSARRKTRHTHCTPAVLLNLPTP